MTQAPRCFIPPQWFKVDWGTVQVYPHGFSSSSDERFCWFALHKRQHTSVAAKCNALYDFTRWERSGKPRAGWDTERNQSHLCKKLASTWLYFNLKVKGYLSWSYIFLIMHWSGTDPKLINWTKKSTVFIQKCAVCSDLKLRQPTTETCLMYHKYKICSFNLLQDRNQGDYIRIFLHCYMIYNLNMIGFQ